MEVMVPGMAPSAPCSPRTAAAVGDHHLPSYCYFFSSAPTSPSRASCYGAADGADSTATTFDFTFGFSGQLQESTPILAAADELFEGGRIRPLNNPHPSILQLVDGDGDGDGYASISPRSPRRSRTAGARAAAAGDQLREVAAERGRSGRPAPTSSSSVPSSRSRRATRSLSPFRGGIADDEFSSPPTSPRGASLLRGCGASGSRKWRLKDLFLFRSASEGRAAGAAGGKDPLLKYTMLKSGGGVDGAGNVSMRKGRGSAASASDMPYTVSRAAAEELRRRTTTPLPFHRNSLFGYLRSNPAIHSISRKLSGYASSNRGRSSTTTTTAAA